MFQVVGFTEIDIRMTDNKSPVDSNSDHFSNIKFHMRIMAEGAPMNAVEIGVRGGAVAFLVFYLMRINMPFP